VAEIVDVACAPNLIEVTVKFAVVAFAATVTLTGTVAAAVSLLVSVTTAPSVGAGPFSVTVAFGFVKPPCTVVALNPSDFTPVAGGATVSVAFWLPPPVSVAEILDVAVAVSPSMLVTLNVVVLLPDGTVAVAGTVAAAVLLLAKVTVTPPVGAVAFNVTVAVEFDAVPLDSLARVAGFKVTEEMAGGLTVRTEVCRTPL
jgi:hypothetical protein